MLDIDDNESLRMTINLYKENFNRIEEAPGIFARLHNILRTRAHELDYEKYGKMDHELSDFILNNSFYFEDDNKNFRAVAFDSIFEFKVSFLENNQLKAFIDKYIIDIHEDVKEPMKNYSYAWLYFKQKDFEKTLELLSKINIVDISFKDNIYKLKIVALIDLKLYEEAFSSIDTFEHYLNNNKNVSEQMKATGKRFTSSIRLLIKALTGSKKEFEIKSVLEKNINSVFGKWFKEKIESLNNNMEY